MNTNQPKSESKVFTFGRAILNKWWNWSVIHIFPETREDHFLFPEFLILKKFFSFGYYTCLIPFKIEKQNETFKLHENKFQKLVTLLLILCGMFHGLVDFQRSCESISKKLITSRKLTNYRLFYDVTTIITSTYCVIWFYTFWVLKTRVLKLIHISTSKLHHSSATIETTPGRHSCDSESVSKLRTLSLSKCVLAFASLILSILHAGKWIWRDSSRAFNGLFLCGTARAYLFSDISEFFQLDDTVFDCKLNTVTDLLLPRPRLEVAIWNSSFQSTLLIVPVAFYYVAVYASYSITLFITSMCYLGALMVHSSCQRFIDSVKKETFRVEMDCDELNLNTKTSLSRCIALLDDVMLHYQHLCQIINAINGVMWITTIGYCVFSMPLLVTRLADLIDPNIYFYYESQQIAFYRALMTVPVMTTAALGNSTLQYLNLWIVSISEKVERFVGRGRVDSKTNEMIQFALSQINLFHQHINSKTVGLEGSKFFTVTFGFMGTMIGLLSTYLIVSLQILMTTDNQNRIENDCPVCNFTCNASYPESYEVTLDSSNDDLLHNDTIYNH